MKQKKIFSLFFLCLLFFSNGAYAQEKLKVHGTVTDPDGEPLIGVTVMESGNKYNVTITGKDGDYTIKVNDPVKGSLKLSYIGFESTSVKINSRSKVDVVMEQDVSELDGVVVIGYGTSKKSDLTGSVSSLRAKSLEDDNSTSLTGMLAGRIPGVHAVATSGAPGSKTNIVVRGASSVSGGTSPLYVIDGVMIDISDDVTTAAQGVGDEVLDPLSMLNPDDIASMEILKDASATAIYGSRGANGVIIVTTKSGSYNKSPEVHLSYDFAVDTRPKEIKMLNGYDYENYMAMKDNFQFGVEGSNRWNEDGTVKHSGKNNNWQRQILRPAFTHNVNASVRGGSKSVSYALSTGFLDKDGIAIGSDMKRLTFNSKLDIKVKPWLRIGMDLKGSRTENNGIISADQFTSNNVFAQMLIYSPVRDVDEVDPDDNDDDEGTSSKQNPVVNAKYTKQNNRTTRIQGRAFVEFTFMKGFTLKSSFGGYLNNTKTKNFYPSIMGVGTRTNGQVTHGAGNVNKWEQENILNFSRTFKKKHSLSAMMGLTFEQTMNERLKVTTKDLMSDTLKEESLMFGQRLETPQNSKLVTSMMSALARVTYSYDNRYLFTASIRADGSSVFPKGNKFSYFPSGAFAWKINEEPWMERAKWLNLLKLRLSVGQTGNQRVGALSSLASTSMGVYPFNKDEGLESVTTSQGLAPHSIGNERLKWETTTQYNVGLDFTAFKGRVSLIIDAYYKDTRDLLITEQLPGISGFHSAVRNIGSVSNKGMEFQLSTVNIDGRDFRWTSDLNISFNRNRVEDIGNGDRIAVTPNNLMMNSYSDVFYIREGYPLGSMWGFVSEGLYQLADFEEFYDADGNFITDLTMQKQIYRNNKEFTLREGIPQNGMFRAEPGAFRPKKIADNDEPVNMLQDRVYLGSAEPIFFGGFNNSFQYKNWYLNIMCNFSYGNKLFNANYKILEGRSSSNVAQSYYENMWTLDRQDGTMVKLNTNNTLASSLQVEDASYFKIKDITLGYNIPKKALKKIGMKGIKIYASAKNVYTFTKYSWYDPEHVHPGALTAGLDRYSYPTSLTVVAGLSLSF